jgi:AcrR family transcriptional regulator
MPRLTRAESQAKTRAALLETARECFLRDGYAETSLDGIALAAGYSKGAVYSNFRNKDELCLAVIDAIRADRAEALGRAMAGKRTLSTRIAALEVWAEEHLGDRAWTALEVAFAVHASRVPELAEALCVRHEAIRAAVTALVVAEAESAGITLPFGAEHVAVAILSLGLGLGVQRALDPNVPVRPLGDVVRALVGTTQGKKKPASPKSKPASPKSKPRTSA